MWNLCSERAEGMGDNVMLGDISGILNGLWIAAAIYGAGMGLYLVANLAINPGGN
jgi:hypothetical protein